MAVPRNKLSNSRKNKRRAHDFKNPKTLSLCANCARPHRPHTICGSCGFYAGRNVYGTVSEEATAE